MPIFAVFVINQVVGATVVTLGISAAIYWIVKSLIQIPIANFLDKTDGERDDFYVLVGGLVLAGVTALLFSQIKEVWQLYAVEVVHAIAFGLYVPSWTGMFSRHLDKKHESLDWSLNSTTVGIASGITGLAGGALASWVGFSAVFFLAAFFCFAAAALIFAVPDIIFPKQKTNQPQEIYIKDHAPLK